MTTDEFGTELLSNVTEDFTSVLDSLLDERNDIAFAEKGREQPVDGEEPSTIRTVGELLQMNMEQTGSLFSKTLNSSNDLANMTTDNIIVGAQLATKEGLEGIVTMTFPPPNSRFDLIDGYMIPMIEIPSAAIINQTAVEENSSVPIVFIINRNTHLPPESGEETTSLVISAQISADSQRKTELGSKPVLLTFNIGPQENKPGYHPRCEFFNFSNNPDQSGSFSTEGITQLSTTNSTFVQCNSNHLTSFAVLVDTSKNNEDNSGSESDALSIVSYIGCVISIVCLLFAIIMIVLLRNKVFNQAQHFVHFNLCIALLLGLVTFVSGIEPASGYRGTCLAEAILLHYFFMAAFSWMLCEGIFLFVKLHFLFYRGFFKSWIFFLLIGWGLPIPIVAISVAVSHEQYGINDICWISKEYGAIWAFIGPMLIIILVNTFFLTLTIFKVYKSVHFKERAVQPSKLKTAKSMIKAAIIINPVLGCTWIFGVLAVNEHTVVFAWLFTILNSLQGFFIMYFYVLNSDMGVFMLLRSLRNKKVKIPSARYEAEPKVTDNIHDDTTPKPETAVPKSNLSSDQQQTQPLNGVCIVSDGKSGETDHSTQHCESLWSTIPLYGHQTEAVVLPCNPAHKTNI
ncbi:adhesion G protein-coupled receptor L3-like [Dysidea avara]|uniref:adhesion G protein-coupled receptor L3-like n=1 Tax=Dysidea avara TaxID=196820 RepID=UPI00331CF130